MSANVGDSGFAVIGRRPYDPDISVKFQTPQQEHMFGCPYQLGHEDSADTADDAMLLTLPVRSLPTLCGDTPSPPSVEMDCPP